MILFVLLQKLYCFLCIQLLRERIDKGIEISSLGQGGQGWYLPSGQEVPYLLDKSVQMET